MFNEAIIRIGNSTDVCFLLCYAILCALLGMTHLQKEFLEYSRIVFQVDVAQAGIKRVFFQSFNGFVVSVKELCKLFSA